MADIFNSYMQGAQFGQQQRAAREQRNQLAELQSLAPQVVSGDLGATDRAYALDPRAAQTYQAEGDRQQQQLLGLAKSLKQAGNNPQLQAGIYRSAVPFLRRSFGAEIPDVFDPASVMPIVDQVLAVGQNQPSSAGGGVQSTYVDNNGQRVAIMRDGSTQVLGGNDAGATQRTLTIDVNGTPTQVTFDSRTGRYSNASLGGQAGGQPMPGEQPQGGYQQINGQQTYIDPSLPPQVQQQIRQSLATGQEPPAQMAFAGAPGGGQAGMPLTGRRAEDQAAAVEAAKLNAQQQFLPQELGMRTDAAIRQAAGTAQAKGEAEARLEAVQNLPRVMQESNNAINLINQALSHPGLSTAVGASGRADPRNYLPGTDATDFRVLLDQIKGGTFLQAFQSLKGGGAITEVEGTKAEQAIARLNRDQSEESFKQSLQDLREVAQAAIARAQAKAEAASSGRQAPPAAGGAPRQIQSAAEYNALPSGALFIAPDGTQRRKR